LDGLQLQKPLEASPQTHVINFYLHHDQTTLSTTLFFPKNDQGCVILVLAAGKHVANDFRTERLYTEEVDIVFKRHQVLLKAIYSRYRLKPPGGGLRTKQLKLEGWNQLMQDTRFLDSHYTIQVCLRVFVPQKRTCAITLNSGRTQVSICHY
jgi:hypothetical protein